MVVRPFTRHPVGVILNAIIRVIDRTLLHGLKKGLATDKLLSTKEILVDHLLDNYPEYGVR
jgi:hypothetical protein